jgi:hypothetical protein
MNLYYHKLITKTPLFETMNNGMLQVPYLWHGNLFVFVSSTNVMLRWSIVILINYQLSLFINCSSTILNTWIGFKLRHATSSSAPPKLM